LSYLNRYQTRFNSPRSRNKFTRVFESSSWRVMRHPSVADPVNRYNPAYGDEVSRDFYNSSIYTTTSRKVASTFLLHPDWV
jgi:hypothetical protein